MKSQSLALFLTVLLLPAALSAQEIIEVGNEPTPGGSAGIDLAGKHAFIAEVDLGLRIIDVTIKTNPVTVSTLVLDGICNDVVVDEAHDIAYVAGGVAGIHVVDISDLADPIHIVTVQTTDYSDGLAIDIPRNLLFNCDYYSSFDVYDVSLPSAPIRLLSDFGNGGCRDVIVDDGIAYVAWDTIGMKIWDYGEDPESPTFLGVSLLPDISYDVCLIGDKAFVAGWYSGVHVVDLSQPDYPNIATINVPGNVRGIKPHPSNTAVTLVSETAGLYIYDVSDPFSPVLSGSCDTPGSAKNLSCGWDYAYVTDYEYFRIYELGDTVDDPILRVEGTVTDSQQGIPIEGARVYFSQVETFTDASGYYSIEGMAPGDWYWAEVSRPGYIAGYFSNLVVGEGVTVHDFTLDPNTVSGIVTDAVTAEPLDSALVSFGGNSDFTDTNGAYEIFAVPPGVYAASVQLDGYQSFFGQGYTIGLFGNHFDFELQPDGDITIHTQPVNPPAIIPPSGRRLRYVVGLTTTDIEPNVYEIRTSFVLPSGNEIIQQQAAVNLQPNMLEWQTFSTRVPASAPPGIYYYVAKVLEFPDIVVSSDHFPFFKQGGAESIEPLEWEQSGLSEWLKAISSGANDNQLVSAEIRMNISPNPFNGVATIHLQVPEDQQVTVRLFNVRGQEVARIVDNARVTSSERFVLDASKLATGVYFAQAQLENGQTLTQKVMLLQ
jgi:hypothetical protein